MTAYTRKAPPRPAALAVGAKRLIAVALFFSVFINVLTLATPLYMLQVYDRVLSSQSRDTLLYLSAITAAALIAYALLDQVRARLLARVAARVGDGVGDETLRRLVATSCAPTAATGGGAGRAQSLRDLDTVRQFLTSPAMTAIFDSPWIIVNLLVLYLLHPALCLVGAIGAAAMLSVAGATHFATRKPIAESVQAGARANGFAETSLRNAEALEGLGATNALVARWRALSANALFWQLRASDREARLSSISRFVRLSVQVSAIGLGAYLVIEREVTAGVIFAGSILVSRALQPVELAVGSWKLFVAARGAWSRLNMLFEKAPLRNEGLSLPRPQGALTVEGVSFVHAPGAKPALRNVSFALEPGRSLGVIGPSGSGKSTLARLIAGVWAPSAGVARLDGANVYDWPREEFGRYCGYLPQDVELFAGTVAENVARLQEPDPELVVQAARRAHCHDTILHFARGYDTPLGDGGAGLSGGQRQRVGLARALYGDPRLVVLDEPNSNLDSEGEQALISCLGALKELGATAVVVAHRAVVLNHVDDILVLRDGAVADFGTRQEVLKKLAAAPSRPPSRPPPSPPPSPPTTTTTTTTTTTNSAAPSKVSAASARLIARKGA